MAFLQNRKAAQLRNEEIAVSAEANAADARKWAHLLLHYREPSDLRGALEIAITLLPLLGLWALMWATLSVGYWLTLLLAIPAAGFLVRLFMIFHDCTHGSFFKSRAINDWVGRVLGILTITPYGLWRRTHALHHAGMGNLDRRGFGDIDTLTVEEYRARSWWGRLQYRVYRHPLILFGIGPAYLFILQQRLPVGLMTSGWRPWLSTMATNLVLALVVLGFAWTIGIEPFLLVHLPILLLASSVGVWLFYVQHQFEHTRWAKTAEWNMHEISLHGSSHYDLPPLLRWFTGNIGMHHVHHLCSRIPYYRLPRVLRDHPQLRDVGRVTLLDSMRCARLALWCETRRRLVSFREAHAAA